MLCSLHSSSSYDRGDLRFDLGGITASIPIASINSTNLLESYPLSAITYSPSNPAINLSDCVISFLSPPVRMNRNGLPRLSTVTWIFALNPPLLFPRAWDDWPPFLGALPPPTGAPLLLRCR